MEGKLTAHHIVDDQQTLDLPQGKQGAKGLKNDYV